MAVTKKNTHTLILNKILGAKKSKLNQIKKRKKTEQKQQHEQQDGWQSFGHTGPGPVQQSPEQRLR